MRAAITSHAFFSPSYRSLHRTSTATNLFNQYTANTATRTSNKGKGRSISFASGGSSSSSSSRSGGPNSRPIKPPPSTTTTTTKSIAVPHAPPLPHTKPLQVVRVDSFFALHRPLLELPLRLSARKTLAPLSRLTTFEMAEERDELDLQSLSPDEVREVFSPEAEVRDEIVEVVDLGADGKPTGPSYLTTMGEKSVLTPRLKGSKVVEFLEDPAIWHDLQEEEALLEQEELDADRKDLPNPYDAWMIGESEASASEIPLTVSRYLAARQPFAKPPLPSLSTPTPDVPTPSSYPSPQAVVDMSFLSPFQPFHSTPLSIHPENRQDMDFMNRLNTPITDTQAHRIASRFLSRHSARYSSTVQRALSKAQSSYANKAQEGMSNKDVMRAFEKRTFVEVGELEEALEGVRMDSVKRKRKKKITKHKYKKRRKAQKALRQRLGK